MFIQYCRFRASEEPKQRHGNFSDVVVILEVELLRTLQGLAQSRLEQNRHVNNQKNTTSLFFRERQGCFLHLEIGCRSNEDPK